MEGREGRRVRRENGRKMKERREGQLLSNFSTLEMYSFKDYLCDTYFVFYSFEIKTSLSFWKLCGKTCQVLFYVFYSLGNYSLSWTQGSKKH